jgi:hypothetical protein
LEVCRQSRFALLVLPKNFQMASDIVDNALTSIDDTDVENSLTVRPPSSTHDLQMAVDIVDDALLSVDDTECENSFTENL